MAEIGAPFPRSGRNDSKSLTARCLMGLNLKALIGKLNDQARSALEGAAGLCLSRTHYDIEIEHYLTKLLESQASDFAKIVKHFGVDKSRLTGELMRSMDKLKSGNARTPAISP